MAKRTIITVLILGLCSLAPGFSYCEEEYTPQDLRVFDGKVRSVDPANSLLTVDGGMSITFTIPPDARLVYDTYGIRLSDINAGDYVTVEYYRRGQESRVPAKVFKVTVKHKADTSEKYLKGTSE